jgi:hypothetical protein
MVKVKLILAQAMKAQRWSKGIALLLLWLWRKMKMCGQRHAPAALLPGKRPGIYCTGVPGTVWTGAKNLAPAEIRYPDGPAPSNLVCMYIILLKIIFISQEVQSVSIT